MKKTFIIAIALFLSTFAFFSCQDDLDDIEVPASLQVNDFIWKGLNLYYYWQQDVPNLSDDRFSGQTELNAFLKGYSSPENLFQSLRFEPGVTDRFSVIYSDYTVLEGVLSGVTKNNGVDFQLIRKSAGSNDVIGWVRYIVPNSDASSKNIQRGDIFYAVDGVSLTIDNYQSLLSSVNYTLNLADYDNGNFTPNGESVSLTKTELTENPILISQVYDYSPKKIGYLMYNGFYNEYDNQLNAVFANFQAQGVTDLVLDLRYNSGGSVQSATYLASMITGQFNGQIFAKQQWNAKVEEYFSQNDPEDLINRFTNSIAGGGSINGLNLSTVYVLTTGSTASASELIINGLKPHINVVQIGETTVGKNVGSITLYDSPTFQRNGRSNRHKYAMQPICFKTINAAGFGEYQDGIEPTTILDENLGNLGQLGDVNEPYLSTAIGQITANARMKFQNPDKTFEKIKDRKSMQPFGDEMYLDEIPFESLNIKFYENK
jgi:carboxyl-terminal processing protease